MIVKVPQLPWYGDTELELEFPPSWEVIVCQMAWHSAPGLTDSEIQTAFQHPIGTPRISEMARGRKEVVIIFDDLSRPTKVSELVPYVLQELKEGGIKDENIRFIASLGAHGAMKLIDFVKKLGSDIVQRFPVYNHNPFQNCTYLGDTSRGTPVSINSEVMSCDFRIAISSILPHPVAGFGGGAKSILPGVAHIDSIVANHRSVGGRSAPTTENPLGKLNPSVGWGKVEGNAVRLDMEAAARMAGIDVIVNAVVNSHRDTVGLFVGDAIAAHREGVKMARGIYATNLPGEVDIVVANAYSKANEAMMAVDVGNKLLPEGGGDLVITCNIPEGQICHYVSRSFGKNIGGQCWGRRTRLPSRARRLLVLGPYVDRAGLDWIGPPELVDVADSWSELLEVLKRGHGDKVKVAVIPDATLQYFPHLWSDTTRINP